MELQNIRENRQAAQRRRIELTSLEQEINEDRESWLKRINIHLERLLDKADRDKTLLRDMVFHYRAGHMSSKARIRNLKEKLKKATKKKKRQKEHDQLQILAEASLAQHNALWRRLSPNFKKIRAFFAFLKILAQKIGFSALCAAPRGARF